jgi:hypothetical protein
LCRFCMWVLSKYGEKKKLLLLLQLLVNWIEWIVCMAMLRDELNECRCRQVLPFVHTHYINTHIQVKECWEQEKWAG